MAQALKRIAPFVAAAACAGLVLLAGAGSVSAQVYGGFYAHPFAVPYPAFRPHPGYYPPAPIGRPGYVLASLAARGYEAIGIAGRRGDVLIVDAISPREERVRLIVDAYDGEILERFSRPGATLPAAAPRGADARRRDAAVPKRSPEKFAELPAPPRRPLVDATQPPTTPASPAAKAGVPPRRLSDWAPINSVPVAPLE